MCVTSLHRRFETQHLLTLLPDYVIPHCNAGVRRIFPTGHIHKVTNCVYMFRRWLETFTARRNHKEAVQATQNLLQLYKGVDYLKKYHITRVKECELCTETEHFSDVRSDMCTVHTKTTHSMWYIRNVYCTQKQNTLTKVHQKKTYVMWTETEYCPGVISQMCAVHTNRTLPGVPS